MLREQKCRVFGVRDYTMRFCCYCLRVRLLSLLLLIIGGAPLWAGELEYNRDIRPILADNCFSCHGADSASRKADLRLDQRDAAIDAGAIVAGDAGQSELLARIQSDDPDTVMPPPETKKSLSSTQKELLRRWIEAGAEYQPHWSFIAPVRPELPEAKTAAWGKNAIDRMVLAKLEQQGLAPAPEADSRTLFRRLHLDITGLPPAPGDVEAFVRDYGERGDVALSDWIDRLMAQPTWGEHRARYWLDAARYGDTHGLHFDNYREMWMYRDWVIRAFNANQPFDQFTVEQLAGDLLPDPTDDQLIATGFQRCCITTNEGGTIDEENLALYATDRVQTFGWVYLGLTTNCSQCHDHKFDPITQKDYYSLAAFFRNTTQPPKDGNVKDGRGPFLMVPQGEDRDRWDALPAEIAAAKATRDQYRKDAEPAFQQWLANVSPEALNDGLPRDGLLLHLPLNEGEGRSVRTTGDAPATFTAASDLTWEKDGKIGPARIVKSGQKIDLGGAGDFERDSGFSYGAWVKPANTNASAAILARMDDQQAYRGWDLWQQGGSYGVHIIGSWPENGMKVVTRDAVVKAGAWQNVFATYDGSGKAAGIRIYVDGVEQPLRVERDNLKGDASIRTGTPLLIGQRSNSAIFEGGAVQDVRLFGRQLSPIEVKAIANSTALQAILGIPEAERTKEQKETLFEQYLVTQDAMFPKLAKAVTEKEAEYEAIRSRSPVTLIQEEKKNSPAMAFVLARGEYDRPGEQVEAATPVALHPMSPEAPKNRLGLAQWVIDPANPLTARVTVNRFWQQLFGRGLVATAEDFGVMGTLPSHPELLDWLAIEFRESGWNVKQFFKLVLMSATYRQAALTTPEKLERDRDNIWLSRGPRYRMDAEMLRDYALASSGLLCETMYGPGVKPYQPTGIWDIVGLPGGNTRNYVQDKGDDLYRRTLYTFWKRMAPPPNLEAFNAPSREVCTVRRERTNTPLQALVTLNDPQFVEAARVLAQQVLVSASGDEAKIVDTIAQRVLSRSMTEPERNVLLTDKQAYLEYYQAHPDDAKALISVGEFAVDANLDPAVLATWTMVCNQVLNLDETLNK